MFAAATTKDTTLSMFRAALSTIVDAHEGQLSTPLKMRVMDILKQALDIADNPSHVQPHTPPEALELAVRLLSERELRTSIGQMADFEHIGPDTARQVLRSIDNLVAA